MPRYPGTRQSVEIIELEKKETGNAAGKIDDLKEEDWATQYQDYLNEKLTGLRTDDHEDVKSGEEEEDWAVQYANYCDEKEKDLFQQSSCK
jgi:hypothetical protein